MKRRQAAAALPLGARHVMIRPCHGCAMGYMAM
jgi:hypothetical protein